MNLPVAAVGLSHFMENGYYRAVDDELELLRKARAFDKGALALIHDRYYPAIYRFMSFRINDPQTAEDLTSEVFTRFLSAMKDRNAPPNTIRGWLYGAARNVLKEQYRKQNRADWTELDEEIAAEGRTPEQRLDERAEKQALREALAELTQEQQDVLALRFGYGMAIKDVAETVSKSEGSVKMLQVRAIAALTKRLAGKEVSDR